MVLASVTVKGRRQISVLRFAKSQIWQPWTTDTGEPIDPFVPDPFAVDQSCRVRHTHALSISPYKKLGLYPVGSSLSKRK